MAQNNLCACHASAGVGKDEGISLQLGGGGLRDLPPQAPPLDWCINSDQTDRIREAIGSYLGVESGHLE